MTWSCGGCEEYVTRADGRDDECGQPVRGTGIDAETGETYPVCSEHRLPTVPGVDPWGLAQSA